MKKIIFLISLLVFYSPFIFSQEKWELNKDSDGIKVYSKEVEGYRFKSFRGTTIIKGTLQNFIFTLSDIKNIPDWGHNVESAKLLEQSGDTIQIYYSIAKAPFPYKNRDGVYQNSYKWDSTSKTLIIDIKVLDEYIEENNKYVRVRGYGYWKIKVLSKNKLETTFSMQVDPGGSVPAWIANMFVDDTPYYTLKNIKKIIENNRNTSYNYNFID
jgi:hypothetical protein